MTITFSTMQTFFLSLMKGLILSYFCHNFGLFVTIETIVVDMSTNQNGLQVL